jgi:hypothetical protein
MLKLYDCDCVMTIRGVRYDFVHVDSVTVEDPETMDLVRGANAGNKEGLDFKSGTKEPKTLTTSVVALPPALHTLIKDVYDNGERVEFSAISRKTGSGKHAKRCLVSQRPQQFTLDSSPESLNTPIILKSFDVEDVLKEPEA